LLQNFTDSLVSTLSLATVSGKAPPITQNWDYAVAGKDWAHYGTNPKLFKGTAIRE
jgi:hypothetical protein